MSSASLLNRQEPAPTVLIAGASVRAAAWSARRAGWTVIGADMFGDEDLQTVAKHWCIEDYPRGLLKFAADFPDLPLMYCGAIENHPDIVDAISNRNGRLWGNSGDVLRAVRDPFCLASALREAGCPVLRVARRGDSVAPSGRWLIKPIRSAAGRAIRHAAEREHALPRRPLSPASPDEPFYLQEFVSGTPISASFIGDGQTAKLHGMTRQLIGFRSLHAAPFGWCGSIGPIALPAVLHEQVKKIGRAVAARFQLRGLFGIDLIVDSATAWVTEVNPRYTASVEVIELAQQRSLLDLHIRVFAPDGLSPVSGQSPHATRHEVRQETSLVESTAAADVHQPWVVGKVVLFANQEFVFNVPLPPSDDAAQCTGTPLVGHHFRKPSDRPFGCIFDRPGRGSTIPAGAPVCSVLVRGRSVHDVIGELDGQLAWLSREFLDMRCSFRDEFAVRQMAELVRIC